MVACRAVEEHKAVRTNELKLRVPTGHISETERVVTEWDSFRAIKTGELCGPVRATSGKTTKKSRISNTKSRDGSFWEGWQLRTGFYRSSVAKVGAGVMRGYLCHYHCDVYICTS